MTTEEHRRLDALVAYRCVRCQATVIGKDGDHPAGIILCDGCRAAFEASVRARRQDAASTRE